MLSEWHAFLGQSGAVIANGRVTGFGDQQQEHASAVAADAMADLSHFGLLKVEGPDSITFMQGQFTNDIRLVTPEHSQLSSYLSPKGRILAAFRIFQRDGAYYLRVPEELLATTLERLRKFVLMSKVTLSDASNELLRVGVSGPHAVARLAQELDRLPQKVDDVAHGNGLTVVRVAGPHPRVEVYGDMAAVQTLWQKLAGVAKPVGASAWALLDIRAAVPTVLPATVEAFVPQMVNMQLVDGVSFRKGCYTGQEVVARMQYLGKLKRRMYLAHVADELAPQPGEEIYCANSESGQGAGKVVDAQAAPNGGFDLLAVVQVSLIDANDTIRLRDGNGPELKFLAMPYEFPVEEAAS